MIPGNSAIILEDKTNTGYFAYRLLDRNELHVIPNYIVFNGCNHLAIICSELQKDFELEQVMFVANLLVTFFVLILIYF